MRALSIFLLTWILTVDCKSELKQNILFFVGMGSHSHRTALEPLAHALVAEGHNITFLTPIKPTKPNPKFNEFSPKGLTDFYYSVVSVLGDTFFPGRLANKYHSATPTPEILHQFEQATCSLTFLAPEFKPWVDSSTFDLIILEHSANKCGFALAYKYKVPVILFSATSFFFHEEDTFGFPVENSWLPNFMLSNVYTRERTFYDKVFVTLYRFYAMYYNRYVSMAFMDKMVREVLELPDMPGIEEIERETRLIFINQHFSSDYARSLPPFVVPVGGMHCEESDKPLPKDLKDFIDGAGEDGFVFISFGTLVSMSKMPPALVATLFKAVETKKTRFLWKWDTEPPANLPKNVFAQKWFPQQELLAHPKIRAFVTHGGLMSMQQAAYFGVPTIVSPVLFDQPYNALTVKHHGTGIHLEFADMEQDWDRDLTDILENKQYMINAKLVAKKFRDRPMTPLDTALYWTKYVMRHKNDMNDLKPLGRHQTWFERRLLDVWLFILAVIIISLFILIKLILFIGSFFYKRKSVQGQKLKTK